jgi:hypothetical protein
VRRWRRQQEGEGAGQRHATIHEKKSRASAAKSFNHLDLPQKAMHEWMIWMDWKLGSRARPWRNMHGLIQEFLAGILEKKRRSCSWGRGRKELAAGSCGRENEVRVERVVCVCFMFSIFFYFVSSLFLAKA